MSADKKVNTTVRGGRRGTFDSSKMFKRDHSTVSPASPEGPVTLASIRILFKEELVPVNSELEHLRKSVEFNSKQMEDMMVLNKKVDVLQKDNTILGKKLHEAESKCGVLQERITSLELYTRRNNLRFSGLKMPEQDAVANGAKGHEDLFIRLFQKVGIPIHPDEIERVHPIGHYKSKNRPFIVRFVNYKSRQKIFTERKKFQEQGVVVTEDFPQEVMKKRKMFQPVLQAAYKSGGKFKAHLSADKLVLNGQSFSSDELLKLPEELQPQNLCNVVRNGKLAFFTSHSKLSNHHQCRFSLHGNTFNSTEQFYNYMKAKHFNDEEHAVSILRSDSPVAAMQIGKRIKNFKIKEWEQVRTDYMLQGLQAKFGQSGDLSKMLKETGQLMLLEANPFDRFWGIGTSLFDISVWSENKWNGKNELGKLLMKVRETL